jgi:hypothetical protein
MRKPDFIVGAPDNPYLARWWLIPRNRWCNVYLHHFLRSDDPRALHDHPWWNISLVLRGGYLEYMNKGARRYIPRYRGPGAIVFRRATTAHRIELFAGRPAWSLFITGPRVRDWGFHCPQGWRHWAAFTKPGAPGEVGPGCD